MPSAAFWTTVTRFGEAQILLPAALVVALWFGWRERSTRLAIAWLLGITAAVAVTTVSKVAFLGYGIGWSALDFTGVSGHSMFAAAIYPLTGMAMAGALTGSRPAAWQRLGLCAGVGGGAGLALLVGASRVMVDAHSWSEVLAGWAVGGAASAVAVLCERAPPTRHSLLLPALVCVWLGSALTYAPPSTTHGLVTRLALAVSGRTEPYTRSDLMTPRRQPQGMLR